MSKRERIEAQDLAELENEFARLLPQCLRECAAGRLGLFANSPIVAVYVDWPEAARLRSLARRIREIHATSGSAHALCDRFLHCCSLRGENLRGEPKLAAELLEELNQRSGSE